MTQVLLIHWNEDELAVRQERLERAGYDVISDVEFSGKFRRQLRSAPPDVAVIDLTRLPSHGREAAEWLRQTKALRCVPFLFVDGAAEKIARTKQQFPDAIFTRWPQIRSAVKKALSNPPPKPEKRPAAALGYSGTPLPKKLGIKSGDVVALLNAPEDFETTLGELPADVVLRHSARGNNDLMIWFAKNRRDYETKLDKVRSQFGEGGLWIAWPKKSSGIETDLNGNVVREVALATGLVDYKVCAIDETWSGHKFARRKDN